MRIALRNLLTTGAVIAASLGGLAGARGADIVLPDGDTCKIVSRDLDPSLANGRVSHFCSDGVALVGGLQLGDGLGLVTRVTYDPNEPQNVFSDQLVSIEVRGVTLEDGTVCREAGHGATLAFDGERANFTCDDDSVLLGAFEADGDDVFATQATFTHDDDGFHLSGKERVAVQTLDASSPIADVEWKLESFGVGGTPALEDAPATLTILAGRAAGRTGCNSYFSAVTFGLDGAVAFSQPGATMMYCEGAMDQEQNFFDALVGIDRYELTADGKLVLSGNSGELVFGH